MNKLSLKMKLIMFVFMVVFMIMYMIFFGSKNSVIGIMIVMAALMNLGNDLSYNSMLSFIKVLLLLMVLGITAFFNNPISIFGCILTFLVVFGTTFTSYHLFSTSVYLPYLMCYFMMMCIPVSIDELPMRLLSLFVGAIFIVGFNLVINRKKSYKLSKSTLDNLISEIMNAIDLKLKGEVVLKENFKVANGFYLSLFSKFQYKYFPSPKQESIINLIKAFQNIGWILAEHDLSEEELYFLKTTVLNIENINSIKFHVKTKEFNLVILNLEIIINELKNKDLYNKDIIPDRKSVQLLYKDLLKNILSFRSVKFTFAFKMAFILTFWEILTLIFNLPYTKWLYFSTIPLMLPYVNDMADSAKIRLKGTIVGVVIFVVILLVMPYVPIVHNILMMLILLICMGGMVYKLEHKFYLTIFTTVMSVMVSLMYITPPEAFWLKILWIIVAIIGVSIVNFGFLPYSVEKETRNNLISLFNLNNQSIDLIKNKCSGITSHNKTTILVVSNIIRTNVEITDENKQLYMIQSRITDISNFILTYMDIYSLSDDVVEQIINCINNGEDFKIIDSVILYTVNYVVKLFNNEKKLISEL